VTPASWFNALGARERMALAIGASVALALAAYGWLWLPLSAETAKLRESVPQLRAQAARLEADAAEVKKLAAKPPPTGAQGVTSPGGDTLASGVEQSVQGAGLKDKLRVVPIDGARVQLVGEGIGFNEWIGLLASLQQSRGAHVESARVEPVPGSALVRAQAALSRAAASN
jgi:type II secretory pathway component PulM